MKDLVERLLREGDLPEPGERICRGTLLSRAQYLVDVHHWGYRDSRVGPEATMSRRDVARWTAAIDDA